MDDGGKLHEQILTQRVHFGPVGDVRTHDKLDRGVGLAEAVVHTVGVDRLVKVVVVVDGGVVHVRRGGDAAAVCRRGGGARIHQAHARKLPLAGLGALAVREVARRVAQGQAVVGGHIARAEAGTAEARLDDRAGLEQLRRRADAHQLERHGHGRRVHVEAERAAAGILAADDVGGLGDVVEQTAAAARDHALIRPDAAVAHFIGQVRVRLGEAALRVLLHLREDLLGVIEELVDRPRVRRVERQGDHGLNLREVDGNELIVPSRLAGVQLGIVLLAAVRGEEAAGRLVRLPDGGQARRLRRHDVDAVAEVDGQALDAGAGELEHAVVDKAALKRRLDEGDGHVVRADAAARRAGEIDEHNLGHVHVPGVFQQLLGKLRAALAHGHRAERAVARVGVGAEDHAAAAGQLLAGVGVDDALVGGDIDAAVFLCGGQAEHVVVLVDRAAHGAQAVVTVRQRVGNRKLLHPGRARLLDDADIGDVVGHHRIEADLQMLRVAGCIVRLQDVPGHGLLPGLLRGDGCAVAHLAVNEKDAVVSELNHMLASCDTGGVPLKIYSTLL